MPAWLLSWSAAEAQIARPRVGNAVADPLAELTALVPAEASQSAGVDLANLRRVAGRVDAYAYAVTQSAADPLAAVRAALDIKHRVDGLLERTLDLRTRVAASAGAVAAEGQDPRVREAARGWLRAKTALIELSGKLRYLQNDVVRTARGRLTDARSRERLADLFLQYRSTVGASQSIDDLFEFRTSSYQEKLLRLASVSGQTSLVPAIVDFVADANQPAPMRLFAAEIIRNLGVPQPPRPNPVEELPEPAVTPDRLHALVSALPESAFETQGLARRQALLEWLAERRERGVVGEAYRVGSFEVRPGDWLLMRNPSPYNLFTDLSPGLFTHVGMVAAETGADGIRRFVIVDVPERGDRVPAVNVEIYLERTLHFYLLRDADAKAAQAMGAAAAAVIDNPSKFDLNFRTDRVLALRHKPLDDVTVHTYCAGLLLLCALQTDVERAEYFPITERQAPGHTVENVAKMGLSLGEDFISPSGALFSRRLQVIGRREPMYDPKREVEESVFDRFAQLLEARPMQAEGSWYHDLRLRLAEASQGNPLLAQALAGAVGVSADLDLVAAAKAAAVVETLDEVALGAGRDFEAARAAVRGNSTTDARQYATLRARHADLIAALAQGRMSPRDVRLALVRYYVTSGNAELERRFFGGVRVDRR